MAWPCYYVGVISSALCNDLQARLAYETGSLIAKEGWILVNGGMGGVMLESSRGAQEAGGVVIGILPGLKRSEGNPYLSYAIPTGLGHLRNALVVAACDALIAIGGGYGTLSEISFANLRDIPVIGLLSLAMAEGEGLELYKKTACTPQEAVQAVAEILNNKD